MPLPCEAVHLSTTQTGRHPVESETIKNMEASDTTDYRRGQAVCSADRARQAPAVLNHTPMHEITAAARKDVRKVSRAFYLR